MVKLALDAFPNCWIAVPIVPGVLDTVKGSASCQHSSVEAPLAAEIAVRFRYVGIAAVPLRRSCSKQMIRRRAIEYSKGSKLSKKRFFRVLEVLCAQTMIGCLSKAARLRHAAVSRKFIGYLVQ